MIEIMGVAVASLLAAGAGVWLGRGIGLSKADRLQRIAERAMGEASESAKEVAGARMDIHSLTIERNRLLAENEALRTNAELYSQVERAAGELPGAWRIEIVVELHGGAVELYDGDGIGVDFDGQGPLSEQVSDAIDLARSAAMERDCVGSH